MLERIKNLFKKASSDERVDSEVHFRSIDDEIARAKEVLQNWSKYSAQIKEVRQLERQTRQVAYDPDLMKRGYYRVEATEGYNRLFDLPPIIQSRF